MKKMFKNPLFLKGGGLWDWGGLLQRLYLQVLTIIIFSRDRGTLKGRGRGGLFESYSGKVVVLNDPKSKKSLMKGTAGKLKTINTF